MKVFALLFLACSSQLIPITAKGQVVGNFPYDPVFWTPTLKLSQEQQRKIREINSEFYEQLLSLSDRSQFTDYLRIRNTQIWATFHSRQKRKWEKIMTRL